MAVNQWGSVVTAWEAVARGGELCPERGVGPTRADLTFESDRHGDTATLWLRPLKKRGRRAAAKVPITFAAHDGGGSDTYAALRRLERHDPVPDAARAATPLFRGADGKAMRCAAFRKLVKSIASGLGFDPAEFGAHSPRIGVPPPAASAAPRERHAPPP